MIGYFRRTMAAHSGLILNLHRVLPVDESSLCYDPHLVLSEPAFISLLRMLRQDYSIVPLDDLLSDPRGSAGRPKVALTFDDGWEDNYRVAFPHLLTYQVPATIFVCTELVGTTGILPEERFARLWNQCASRSMLADLIRDLKHWGFGRRTHLHSERQYWAQELKRLPLTARLLMLDHFEQRYEVSLVQSTRFLSWDDLRVMTRTGLVQVGSHTSRHATLSSETSRDARRELEDSRAILWKETGIMPTTIAYPNGMYNRTVMELARAAGYTSALAVHMGLVCERSNPFALPRIAIDDTTVTNNDLQLSNSRASAYFVSSWLRTCAFSL